jgi:hypothetical protein
VHPWCIACRMWGIVLLLLLSGFAGALQCTCGYTYGQRHFETRVVSKDRACNMLYNLLLIMMVGNS